MSNDRREFEAWAISDGWDVTPADSANAELGATYQAIDTECVYVGWQAHAGSVAPDSAAIPELQQRVKGEEVSPLAGGSSSLQIRHDEMHAAFMELAKILDNPTLEADENSSLEMELVKLVAQKLKAESLSGAACDCGSHDLAPLYHHPSCPSAQPSLDTATPMKEEP